MAKSPKHRSSSKKKSPSKSPRSKDSSLTRGRSRKTSRSRSRSRSTHSASRSRSGSRGRASPKKKSVSPVVRKFDISSVKKFDDSTVKKSDDSAVRVRRIVPSYRSSRNGSGYKAFPFSDKEARRRTLTMRLLQPMNMSNLKVKGVKLKQRLSAHCKQFSRFYTILLVLGLIALGIFYTGYTVDQMAKYARQHIDYVSAYIQRRR
uniref:Penicillin-binding protein n=1 Tax=Elaeophora elaphi TaxID=1147741 RepID=A0A0R3RPQ1_9BILA